VRIDREHNNDWREVSSHGSSAAKILHLTRTTAVAVSLLELGPDGLLGLHPAERAQLLLVLEGSCVVRTERGDPVLLEPWSSARWEAGELHETRSAIGLRALIVEGEGLEPVLVDRR
jgi:quercetin dioxygenase-like cupin family protein